MSCQLGGPGDLLRPAGDDVLTQWKVSSRVNSVRNNKAEVLEEVDRAGAQAQAEAGPEFSLATAPLSSQKKY